MGTTGADLALDGKCGIQTVNAVKNNHAGVAAPGSPVQGVSWWDTGNTKLQVYDGGWADAVSENGGAVDGMIVAYCPGYFTDGSNGGFAVTGPAGNTVAEINTYLNASGWYVCDGAAVNDGDSAIWSAAGRYLPNLTSDRFIMGDTAIGGIGGANTMAHTHAFDPPDTETGPPDNTLQVSDPSPVGAPAGEDHTHMVNYVSTTSNAASNAENQPLYLACFYIVKVK